MLITENLIRFSATISELLSDVKDDNKGIPLAAIVDFRKVLLGNIV